MLQLKRTHKTPLAGPCLASGLYTTLAIAMLILAACAKPQIVLDRVLVRNATPGTISDVKVSHEPTLRFGAVSLILPETSYEIAFPKQPMLAKQAVVDWRDDTGRPWSVPVALPNNSSVAEGWEAVSLVYEIQPAGQVTVSLQPSP